MHYCLKIRIQFGIASELVNEFIKFILLVRKKLNCINNATFATCYKKKFYIAYALSELFVMVQMYE